MKSGLIGLFWSRSASSFAGSGKLYARGSGVPKKAPLAEVSGRNFPAEGKNFDRYFVSPEVRKKAWDGQDKDTYFRDKYAHVHARQRKERDERKKVSPYKASRSFTKNKLGRLEQAQKLGITPKKELNILVDRRKKKLVESEEENDIQRSFARKFAEGLERDPRREFIYGTGPVTAVLQANKRKVLALYTRDRRDEIPTEIRELCKARKLKVETGVPNAHLNIMTNNGIHNKYVLEVRPLEKRQLVSLGNVWEGQEGQEGEDQHDKKLRLPISEVEDGKIVTNQLNIGHNEKKAYPLALFIDEVTDAHNFGAIVRSAYYLGVDFIVHAEKNSAKLSAVVDKTSAGAMEHIEIFNASQPLKFFELSKDNGWKIIATSVDGQKGGLEKTKPSELKSLLESGPCMLVIGSEGKGLRTSLVQRSTHVVTWKGFQDVTKLDSLNVSVATGLLLSKFYKEEAFD